MRFDELKELLFARSNFGVKLGLDGMREACALLGNPERGAPVLHVAGTNGKGSTCAFAEASLRAAGLRTGLYTSPHLNHFCERIRIDGEPVSEERACELLEEVRAKVPWALGDPGLTFFEIVTLMAFLAFRGVDVMVVEVGLGGRLDATNVVLPRACAIAPLGLEHTQYLGPTLAHIATEKAGILKPGARAVSAGQPLEAARVLQQRADAVGVSLWRPGRDYRFESRDVRPFCYAGPRWVVRGGAGVTPATGGGRRPEHAAADLALQGHHQRTNAALACALLEASGLCEPRHAEEGLRAARWPARLERFGNVYVDGAHNPHAARALAHALPPLLAGRPMRLVFGALQDKDAGAMLRELAPLAASVHYCAPDSPRAVPPQELARLHPGAVHGSVSAALEAARGEDGVVVCCGSLYLAGEARALMAGEARERMPSERL
ncbi:MAG TPA: folylpolyglutamate synthase/dihydrofolate synthase family protein [Myxococcales bacterium]|jgi:dihydrofolate synthase/folylpolyglutamate synthase|nr:folylpolyglutamate synthase/dihydrofolate synthase family protein [Myxococcales bacterium]